MYLLFAIAEIAHRPKFLPTTLSVLANNGLVDKIKHPQRAVGTSFGK